MYVLIQNKFNNFINISVNDIIKHFKDKKSSGIKLESVKWLNPPILFGSSCSATDHNKTCAWLELKYISQIISTYIEQ